MRFVAGCVLLFSMCVSFVVVVVCTLLFVVCFWCVLFVVGSCLSPDCCCSLLCWASGVVCGSSLFVSLVVIVGGVCRG